MKKSILVFFFAFCTYLPMEVAGVPWLLVKKSGNVHSGPGIKYLIVDKVKSGDIIEAKDIAQHNEDGIATWFPIEFKIDESGETTIGWFGPIEFEYEYEYGKKVRVGDQIWFFEDGTEDPKEGYLVKILPGKKEMPGGGTYRKGKFSTISVVGITYTKWVHSSLVEAFYSKQEADRQIQISKQIAILEEKVRKIPVRKYEENLEIYQELLSLNPESERYQKKVKFYLNKIVEPMGGLLKLGEGYARLALKVMEFQWRPDDDYSKVYWAAKITNISEIPYKDINLKVGYYGPSGTRIYKSIFGHTEYMIIKPHETVTIKFEDHFINKQTVKAGIWVSKATPIKD